jgi:hypothetical protein
VDSFINAVRLGDRQLRPFSSIANIISQVHRFCGLHACSNFIRSSAELVFKKCRNVADIMRHLTGLNGVVQWKELVISPKELKLTRRVFD